MSTDLVESHLLDDETTIETLAGESGVYVATDRRLIKSGSKGPSNLLMEISYSEIAGMKYEGTPRDLIWGLLTLLFALLIITIPLAIYTWTKYNESGGVKIDLITSGDNTLPAEWGMKIENSSGVPEFMKAVREQI